MTKFHGDGAAGTISAAHVRWWQGHSVRWITHVRRSGMTEIVIDHEAFQRSLQGKYAWYITLVSPEAFRWLVAPGLEILVRDAESLDPSDPCWGGRAFAEELQRDCL